eukprot:m.330563 g.330563  ORF g.330563 m.330563 type:complete len:113 (+) comp16512_c1_seq8:105-443(+)
MDPVLRVLDLAPCLLTCLGTSRDAPGIPHELDSNHGKWYSALLDIFSLDLQSRKQTCHVDAIDTMLVRASNVDESKLPQNERHTHQTHARNTHQHQQVIRAMVTLENHYWTG